LKCTPSINAACIFLPNEEIEVKNRNLSEGQDSILAYERQFEQVVEKQGTDNKYRQSKWRVAEDEGEGKGRREEAGEHNSVQHSPLSVKIIFQVNI
jgi:hypothetical protein